MSAGRVGVSVTVSGFTRLFGGDLRAVLDMARAADGAGVDQLVLPDHVVMGPRTDRYPYGTFPYGPTEPWPEPMTLLAAMAGVTQRVRLATGVLISPLRPAVVLAKTAATLDAVSGGRLDLGVGTGWQREEYEAAGVPFAERYGRMYDQLRACVALWTREPPVSFESASVVLHEVWCEPRPVQREAPAGIPLWFGVPATDANAARIAELGTGWLPIHTTTPEELSDGIARLRAAFAAAGRDPATLGVRAGVRVAFGADGTLDEGALRDELARVAEEGITSASVGLGRHLKSAGDVAGFLEAVARASHP